MASSAAGDNSFIAEFPLSASSFLKINKGDIIKWFINGSSDAIVNPANERMLGGGGAYRAIHRAAGPELFEVCFKVHEVSSGIRCPTGEARITPYVDWIGLILLIISYEQSLHFVMIICFG
ncbi:Macro domain-containing protein XCC3184 [Linum perenne]